MDSVVNYLSKRQCAQCPAEVKTNCPSCPPGSYCSLTFDACGCTKPMCIDSSGKLKDPPGKPNAGAIGGGVVVALVVTAIIAFFVWRSMKRKRKLQEEAEARTEKAHSLQSARHSQASISTTATRASNVIQIGFIPGVNGRSVPSTPGLIPPVPAIPHGLGTPSIKYPQSPGEGTFFSAEDILRASVYTTGTLGDHDPRASVATTIYGSNAVVQPVAANVVRAGKANVVQVKSGTPSNSTPHLGSAPPVPPIDPSHLKVHLEAIPPSPAFSVGSTFINKMSERNQEPGSEEQTVENKGLSIQKRPVPGRAVQAVAAVVTESVWESLPGGGASKQKCQTINPHNSPQGTESEHSPFSDRHSLSDVPLPAGNGLPPTANSRRVSRLSEKSNVGSTVTDRRMSPFDDSNAVGKEKDSL